jgi:hypothetical protein
VVGSESRVSKTPVQGTAGIVSPFREAVASDDPKGTAKGTDPAQRKVSAARQSTSTEQLRAIAKRADRDDSTRLTASLPAPQNLIVGTTRAALEQQYGKPTVDVVARHDGSLVERYFYVSRDHAHITVATLRDGKVVSAASVPR